MIGKTGRFVSGFIVAGADVAEKASRFAAGRFDDVLRDAEDQYREKAGWFAYQTNPEYRTLANRRYAGTETRSPVFRTFDEWVQTVRDNPGYESATTRMTMQQMEDSTLLVGVDAFAFYMYRLLDGIPAHRFTRVVSALGERASIAASGYSSVEVWNANSWVFRTLPHVLNTYGDAVADRDYVLGDRICEAGVRVGWGKPATDLIPGDDDSPFVLPMSELVEDAFRWLADNAERVCTAREDVPVLKEWFGVFSEIVKKMRAGATGWPGEYNGYDTFEQWVWQLGHIAEHAEVFAKTGEPGDAAVVFDWLAVNIWTLWD